MAKNDFQYGGYRSYTLQCGTIMTLISPGDCTLQCDMWLWNRDNKFTKWQHPTMWQVALAWYAIEFPQTSAILEFYIWFRFWPYHRSRHVILHQSAKLYQNRTTLSRKNMTSCRFLKWRISAILDFKGPITGSLKSRYKASYRSSVDTIALNCLVLWENRVFCILATDRRTDEHMDRSVAWSGSRCRERRLNIRLLDFLYCWS